MRAAGGRAVALLVLALAGCDAPGADAVFVNGRVFTANPDRPWAEAVAVRGDRVIAVGASAGILDLASSSTTRIDLDGRTLIPGLNDAHVSDAAYTAALDRGLASMVTAGVTSVHWFVGTRSAGDAVQDLVAAGAPLRIRVLRMPRPGPEGGTLDSRPHLPPQPTSRIDVRGMGFRLGPDDGARLEQAVGWAYSTEDLLALEPADDQTLEAYVDAVERTGPSEVWRRKRPRVEYPGPAARKLAPRMAAAGMVAVQRPGDDRPLASLLAAGVPLALASGAMARPFEVLAWATSPDRGDERLTMAQALAAYTRGSAFAELADRDKGHVSVGALADLAVLSVDPFSASLEELHRARSVLTMIGGRIVHDVP